MKKHIKRRTTVLSALMATCLMAVTSMSASAQETGEPKGLIPAQNAVTVNSAIGAEQETHPPLRLTPDKSEILNVNDMIERVVIGNDAHINIFLDSAKRLIVVPRTPGATHFTVLGADGKVLMQRHAIVASPKQDYVRIRRTCSLASTECTQTAVYYCPDMCHEIGANTSRSTSSGEVTVSFPPDMVGMPMGNAGSGSTSTSNSNGSEN